nr:ABC transporter membrane protein [Pantoea sp.]
MKILSAASTQPAPTGAAAMLKMLGMRHSKKLIITLGLVVAENALYLLYPLLAALPSTRSWRAMRCTRCFMPSWFW